eukprot:768410-Hanusia_phi.AAC.1
MIHPVLSLPLLSLPLLSLPLLPLPLLSLPLLPLPLLPLPLLSLPFSCSLSPSLDLVSIFSNLLRQDAFEMLVKRLVKQVRGFGQRGEGREEGGEGK